MSERTDEERMQWLEDNLWNAWEAGCLMDRKPNPYYVRLGGDPIYEADSLREAIDKAMEAE